MAVDSVRNQVKRMPPLPELVRARVETSDPRQRAQCDEKGRLHLSGTAAGLERDASELTLAFDGAHLTVTLSAGTTPEQTARLLERVMPDGYRFSVTTVVRDELVGEIIRRPKSPPPRARPAASSVNTTTSPSAPGASVFADAFAG